MTVVQQRPRSRGEGGVEGARESTNTLAESLLVAVKSDVYLLL